jgi:hypothetical protein
MEPLSVELSKTVSLAARDLTKEILRAMGKTGSFEEAQTVGLPVELALKRFATKILKQARTFPTHHSS